LSEREKIAVVVSLWLCLKHKELNLLHHLDELLQFTAWLL